uniref:Phosphatidylinositol glycan anchor biosynthesis class U protein n=1 Tax=Panagrolaimus sp. JU765 TaxID=591449 RepID=A0AC34QZW7_9BILA
MMRKRDGKSEQLETELEPEKPPKLTKISTEVGVKTFLLALKLRIVAHLFLYDYLNRSPEFTTPWNSFKRLQEAVFVVDEFKINAYQGDNFHLMPILLKLFGPLTHFPFVYHGAVIVLDIFAGFLLQNLAKKYLNQKEVEKKIENVEIYSDLACLIYLFNPMTIGASAVGSISTLLNFLVVLFLRCLIFQNIYMAASLMVVLVFIYPYYIVLMAPLLLAANSNKLITLSIIFATTGSLFAVNCLVENAIHWIPDTFYFFWSIKDLSPNVGLFWYLFVFVFDQYRQFFLWTFQLTSVFPVIPLALTVKKDAILLTFGCLAHVAVLSSYPSYAEATVLLAMYPLFPKILRYTRNALLSFGTIVAALVLAPIMWRMWMVTGSGNANFYFAITVVYCFALILLVTDVFYGYKRLEFAKKCQEEGIDGTEQMELTVKGITPFISEPSKLVS